MNKSLRNFDSNSVLAKLGLERRRDPITDILLPSAALVAAGAALGAVAALLWTPKSGPAMRRDLTDGARELRKKIGAGANHALSSAIGSNHAPTTRLPSESAATAS